MSIIAVLYIIWAGFNILTGNGDDAKLQEAKKTILHIIIGIVLMWLAYSIVTWIIGVTTKNASTTAKNRSFIAQIIPQASAQAGSYTESQAGTFLEYKSKLQGAIEDLETELRINQAVSISSLQNVKNLLQQAADRLPDKDTTIASRNESAKKAVDLYLGLAMKDPTSSQAVGEAISKVASFIGGVQVQSIQ